MMAKEICISSTPHETRLAILEDDQLAEIYYERENEYTLAGSIYNGRVTRVLPGMQSAFVDVGLERDAFLYVTDFMELEDPEETDEIEKAATSPGGQQVREVRAQDRSADRSQDKNGGRSGQQQRQESKPEQKQEPRPDQRQGRERRPAPLEAGGAIQAPSEPNFVVESAEDAQDESNEAGAKRWRGRRRRRGGRSQAGSGDEQTPAGEKQTTYVVESEEIALDSVFDAEPESKTEVAPEIYAGASPSALAQPAPVPFVLPGESLSKYGGASAVSGAAPASAAPPRPQSTYKPATLIESPIEWDGSGLLPGESLSRHRNRATEPAEHQEPVAETHAQPSAEVHAEPRGVFVDSPNAFFEEVQESEELKLDAAAETAVEEIVAHGTIVHQFEEEVLDDLLIEETTKSADRPEDDADAYAEAHSVPEEAPAGQPVLAVSEAVETGDEIVQPHEPEPNAEASHNVDPIPPTGFRLFGLGGKKKKEEEPAAQPKAAAVASVSSYAPGKGLIEEEVIDEEESYAPARAHQGKSDLRDNEDFEEETLPRQMRTGDLGELFQEAHLDHRIQLNFDGDGDEGEEEEAAPAVGQPATGEGQQRRDRNGRNRRGGRGGNGSQAGQPAQAPGLSKGRGAARRSAQMSDLPIISDLLKPGQEILVQIAKEPIAQKGARITSHIALPGRFLVFMPTVTHIGVSRKIASDEERHRLKRILVHERGESAGGFIVRTAAEGASEEELRADLRFLIHLWNEIKTRSDESKSPALIYHDLSLIERILRDQVSSNFSSIWVDSEANYERIVRFLNRVSPELVRRVKLYTKETPLFEHFGIQDEIAKALRSKVWLKSGGSIVINQTEALVAIDINTGKYVGKSARLEDTIVKTNLDAVPEIVRQIRLRDLGGIIVIDFIDMDDRKNRFKVLAALEEALKSDRAPTKVLQFNDFGLVAITRKRVKQSLERTLSVPCPTCQATGMVKSPTTVCNEIYTELRKMKKHFESADVLLRVNPETVKVLKQNNASWLTEFEELVGKNILVKSDATLHPEQFDIQG